MLTKMRTFIAYGGSRRPELEKGIRESPTVMEMLSVTHLSKPKLQTSDMCTPVFDILSQYLKSICTHTHTHNHKYKLPILAALSVALLGPTQFPDTQHFQSVSIHFTETSRKQGKYCELHFTNEEDQSQIVTKSTCYRADISQLIRSSVTSCKILLMQYHYYYYC